jgi:geranylgeranyl pyrophosphate synthase
LCARIEAVLAADEPAASDVDAIAAAVRETGALAATRKLAEEHANRALDALAGLPEGPPRDALETVVLASLERVS